MYVSGPAHISIELLFSVRVKSTLLQKCLFICLIMQLKHDISNWLVWYQSNFSASAKSGLWNLDPNFPPITSFPHINRGMKWKWEYAPHHNNERVVVLTLGKACFIGQIAVRDGAWRCQWRSHQPPRQSRASPSGLFSSKMKHSHPVALTCYNKSALSLHSPLLNGVFLCVFVGVWNRTRTWALFCRRPEKGGLRSLLQIQKKAVIQVTPFHRIQWEYAIPNTRPMGSGWRLRGARYSRRRIRGVKADLWGKGCDQGGVWSCTIGSWTSDRAW